MTDLQLNTVIRAISALSYECEEQAVALFKSAASEFAKQANCTKANCVKFSKEEINKMPKTFRKEFRTHGCTARIRRRKISKNAFGYEIRLRSNGYNVTASSPNLDDAKKLFIQKLSVAEQNEKVENSIPTSFDEFATYFFENFYKRKVGASSYRVAQSQFKNHLLPHFNKLPLKKITPKLCQTLLDRLVDSGKGKTADDIHSLLNMIFKTAVKHSVMANNPIDMVFHKQHEREHGTALTKAEEKLLLDTYAGSSLQTMFAIALYTGMRPNEYETAKLDGEFIIAVNSKRKNGKVEYKKIPITPMLKPYLNGVTVIEFSSLRIIRDRFNKLFPNHKLYDLRTTFYTRCQECGVAEVARDLFVGHSLGALGNAYTDISDEYLLKEGQKLNY